MAIGGISSEYTNYLNPAQTDNNKVSGSAANNQENLFKNDLDTVTLSTLRSEDSYKYKEVIQELENLSSKITNSDDEEVDLSSIESVSKKIEELHSNNKIYNSQINVLDNKIAEYTKELNELEKKYEMECKLYNNLQIEETTEKEKLKKVEKEISNVEFDVDKQNQKIRLYSKTEITDPDKIMKEYNVLSLLLNNLNTLNNKKSSIDANILKIQDNLMLQQGEMNSTQTAISSMSKLIDNLQIKKEGIQENLNYSEKEYKSYNEILTDLKAAEEKEIEENEAEENIFIKEIDSSEIDEENELSGIDFTQEYSDEENFFKVD